MIKFRADRLGGRIMKTEVTDEGLLIPKQLLEGVKEVEIRKEKDVIVIIPLPTADPILELGKNPIADDLTDASVGHDRYVYP
jgi:virulence-associated protein VagC